MAMDMLVDGAALARARAQLGANFGRILGYFREDGAQSVAAIEAAVRSGQAAALVIPAHTLKGEARQFGAAPLADLAETIEVRARLCVERHEGPDDVVEAAARLRPMFEATLTELERGAVAALGAVRRPTGFGRRVG